MSRWVSGDDVIRFLPVLVELFLFVFCLIDVITTPSEDCRNLGKTWWILLIIFIPVIGGIAWLVAGHPWPQQTGHWAPGAGFPEAQRPVRTAADIDAELAANLRRVDEEHEEMLRRWEADLRAREERTADPANDEKPGDDK